MDKKIAVIGVGNPFRGDDGIGIYLMHQLKKQFVNEPIDFIDGGTGGMNLFHIICSYEMVLLIDAVDFHSRPGDICFFSSEEIVQSRKKDIDLSTHNSDIYQIIKLVKEFHTDKCKIYIFGIQPKKVDLSDTFSEEIKQKRLLLIKELKKKILWIQQKFIS